MRIGGHRKAGEYNDFNEMVWWYKSRQQQGECGLERGCSLGSGQA